MSRSVLEALGLTLIHVGARSTRMCLGLCFNHWDVSGPVLEALGFASSPSQAVPV